MQEDAEKVLREDFPHINDECKLNYISCFGAMETDIRRILKNKYTPVLSVWLIDAVVCHYTGRGTELPWT